MTKETMIKNYRKFSAADAYILGFEYKHIIYMVIVDEIMPRYMKVERESTKKGGKKKLQLRLCKQYKEQLLRKGAIALGDESILNGTYNNKGVEFEKLIFNRYNQEFRGKDNVPFHKGGDININGVEVQVKYLHARICYDKTLTKLKKAS